MNRDDRRILRRAANMLLTDAALTRESCMVGRLTWACADCDGMKCHARRVHDAHIRTADQLKSMARRA